MARIIVNPKVFEDSRDAKCVAYNEALRLVMEEMEFDPVSEPTEEQRRFFADTAYAEDERMLRRTILARICVFDTSVKNPTDEQIQEAVEFLESVMEAGAPQSAEEQSVLQRSHDILVKAIGAPASPQGREAAGAPRGEPPQGGQEQAATAAAEGKEAPAEPPPTSSTPEGRTPPQGGEPVPGE